jgi:peptidoglycan L-alanyl-D-glutamate endopeptidase CwlK
VLNSRSLDELTPAMKIKCQAFIDKCKAAGIDVLITSTYRDFESQNALYAQGRTTPGKKVTNAKGGESYHNYRIAFDFVPIINGKAMWSDLALFKKCGEIGKSLGLEWAGEWQSFREYAHFQEPGHTIASLKKSRSA